MARNCGISEAKAALRRQARAARAQLFAGAAVDPAGPGRALARDWAGLVAPGAVAAFYWPLPQEADPRPAMAAHPGACCLPVVTGRGQPLVFRGWQPGAALVPGAFGALVPVAGAVCTPQVLVVPLLAFDGQGGRLGYGGGFYDRTLAVLRAEGAPLAIGLAFAAQQLPEVPREATDLPLDLIVTEAGTIRPG